MASTVSTATLKILIQEDITLNNKVMGGKTFHNIPSINEVSERILTVPTHQVSILALSSSAGAGTYVTGKVKYIRITNEFISYGYGVKLCTARKASSW